MNITDTDAIDYIAEHPAVRLLLEELDLMPDKLTRYSHDWYSMLIIVGWIRNQHNLVKLEAEHVDGNVRHNRNGRFYR